MRMRERQNEPRPQSSGTNEENRGDLETTRNDAERLLATADTEIDRALSTDSTAFLAANRQHGGQ